MQRDTPGIRLRVRSRRQLRAIETRPWTGWRWLLIAMVAALLLALAYYIGRHDAGLSVPPNR